MMYRESLTFLLFLPGAIGQHLPTRNINWFPCQETTPFNVTCGFLTVPLDYVNTSSTTTMRLSMVKMNASKQPKQGTILLNPGGPGSSGREFLAGRDGPGLQIATGGTFDLIGFDPRCVHFLTVRDYLLLRDIEWSCAPRTKGMKQCGSIANKIPSADGIIAASAIPYHSPASKTIRCELNIR